MTACSKAPESAPTSAKNLPTAAPASAIPANPPAATVPAPMASAAGVAWFQGDIDAAFAAAKADNKPLFLYWGAVWCPPCNQVKATIFNRQDFVERSRFFVPVYLDGDKRSAQRQGARFKVGGYPTMILFNADGTEITRLPGEVDGEQYMRVLVAGMNGARPVKTTLAAALAPSGAAPAAKLTPEDWRMLAYYSWETDEQQLVANKDVPATLHRLAQACPADQPATAIRLGLKATAAAAAVKGAKPRDDKGAREQVLEVLADNALARENFDLVTESAGDIAGYVTLPAGGERAALIAVWDAALERFVADPRLSATDRLTALDARIDLAKLLAAPKGALPDSLVASVRAEVARGDKETVDPYARETVINAAAHVLANADLLDESDALLKAELARSRTPYYFMLGLAANAKKRGDKVAAVDWAEKAHATASGPATRLQWGVNYVNTLIDLTPNDAGRIEKAAGLVIAELEPAPDTFYDRNRRSLERMARKLLAWNKQKPQQEALRRIRAQLASVCVQLPATDPARKTCNGVWNSAPPASS
jgi:thiol-disulfide isomerase/thioredoxin